MSNKNKITEGVIWKEVILLFIPIVISSFFQHFYTFVDGVIVGQNLGDAAFAAIGGSSSKIITMLINFFVGVSAGITAYTARFYGKDDIYGVKKVIANGMGIFAVLGLVLSSLGIIFSKDILNLMGTPSDTFVQADIYLKTFLFGLIFCVAYNTLSGVLRAIGDSKTPLYALIFCSFVNIFLDILLVVVIPMGVLGVAAATLVAQGLSAIILGYVLYKKLPKENEQKITIDTNMIKEICQIGIPAGLQSIMYSLSNILVQSAINGFGMITVAAWSAYLRIDGIVDIFVSALGSTVITFVGQNLGANKIDRVKESVSTIIKLSYIITSIVMVVFILFRSELLSLFTNDSEVIEIGSRLFFIIMPMYLLGIPQTMFIKALQGLGKSFVPMMFTLVGVIGIRVIWVLLIFPLNPSIYLLAACYPISSLTMSLIFTIYYRLEVRKFAKVKTINLA